MERLFIWRLLPAATKLWPRLCFYRRLWFCPGGGLRRTPPDQADPLGPRRTTPPRTKEEPPLGPRRNPPPGKKTAAYGQWAAGTHPTGMQSYCSRSFLILFLKIKNILILKFFGLKFCRRRGYAPKLAEFITTYHMEIVIVISRYRRISFKNKKKSYRVDER